MTDFLDRFFGRAAPGTMNANAALEAPLGLQLLFPAPPDLDADALALALRGFHPELASAQVELIPVPPEKAAADETPPSFLGLAGWGPHVVKLVGFAAPMPREVVEACVRPAHFDDELKQAAYANTAHVLLYYAGYHPDPLEQYVALAALAASLSRFGAIITMNEPARAAIPAAALLPHEGDAEDSLESLRSLPLPPLYAGFVKLEVDGQPGVWMRTFGCQLLGLPNLALRADGHHEGTFVFEVFGNMLDYLRHSGKALALGDTIQVGDDEFLRVRTRTDDEWYLDAAGEMIVCDRVRGDEVNP
jgi:hypothetical protein